LTATVSNFHIRINRQSEVRLVCQTNVETCAGEISAIFGSNFDMPVVYYRQLKSVAHDPAAEEPAPDGQINQGQVTGGDSCQIKI